MSEIIDEIITKKKAIDAVNGVLAPYIPRFVGSYEKIPLDCYMAIIKTPTVKAVPIEVLQEIRAEIDSHCSDNRDRNDGLYIAMKIIDKHLKDFNA